MDVCLVIKERLDHLRLEQKDLASAAEVTESYISQLLTRKKLPPASARTDIYEKMERFLKLPSGRLARLADLQRKEDLMRGLEHPPAPLFGEARELILRKCSLQLLSGSGDLYTSDAGCVPASAGKPPTQHTAARMGAGLRERRGALFDRHVPARVPG